ncbi:hypothetical protein [uncultured Microbacterium sp.]|uniref:hypothetical protein n=1 Tax=uncultured Microbacterium sp. TaxID=191216 RepID=UPI0035CB2B1C
MAVTAACGKVIVSPALDVRLSSVKRTGMMTLWPSTADRTTRDTLDARVRSESRARLLLRAAESMLAFYVDHRVTLRDCRSLTATLARCTSNYGTATRTDRLNSRKTRPVVELQLGASNASACAGDETCPDERPLTSVGGRNVHLDIAWTSLPRNGQLQKDLQQNRYPPTAMSVNREK